MKTIDLEIDTEKLIQRIVYPHPKVSREVLENDVEKVIEESRVLYLLCFAPIGRYKGALAMHHAQIDDTDPLNFFITAERKIVINPVILDHTKTTVDSREGCMSFFDVEPIIVQRWNKIDVEYTTLMTDPEDPSKIKLSSRIHQKLSGQEAKVFQHEFNHGLGKYIYPYEPKITKEGLEVIT